MPTYTNPVYPHDFADPFVLKTPTGYFAYGTASPGPDGRLFPVLHSDNLTHWKPLGGALIPLQSDHPRSYWAPEVAFHNHRYYLFYSANSTPSDDSHRLRVATSDNPAGPFTDSGRLLLPDAGFSIDASPFQDPQTGKWFLFFATDYESDEPFGTGLAVVPLADDLLSAVGQPQLVNRAQADWQIYERNRNYKGKLWTKWHCVEGPNCVFHDGRYYCLYSGGAWYSDRYGVGFASAPSPMGPWTDLFAAKGPTVLTGIPNLVIGPGHNSTVLGPDNKTLYMVYHAWDPQKTARRMCIDPITWTPEGPKVQGPTTTPQPLK